MSQAPKISAAPAGAEAVVARTPSDLVPAAPPQRSGNSPIKKDNFTTSGRSAAARALVQNTPSVPAPQVTVGQGDCVDAATAFAKLAFVQRLVDDDAANRVASALDKTKDGFATRLTHLTLERAMDYAVISGRARQRLSSSLTQAFGRTGEKLDPARDPNKDNLGLARGEARFTDALIEALAASRGGASHDSALGLSNDSVAGLVKLVKASPTAEALRSAFEAFGKLLGTRAFSNHNRFQLLSAFLQGQARLRETVIPVTHTMASQGLVALQPAVRSTPLSNFDIDALKTLTLKATPGELEAMRSMFVAVVRPPLFAAQDARKVTAAIDQRIMMVRVL